MKTGTNFREDPEFFTGKGCKMKEQRMSIMEYLQVLSNFILTVAHRVC